MFDWHQIQDEQVLDKVIDIWKSKWTYFPVTNSLSLLLPDLVMEGKLSLIMQHKQFKITEWFWIN